MKGRVTTLTNSTVNACINPSIYSSVVSDLSLLARLDVWWGVERHIMSQAAHIVVMLQIRSEVQVFDLSDVLV